jgi:hypothetical protein
MLRLDWDSLRAGDRVLVHGDWSTELALVPGVVVMVDAKRRAPNGVGVRIGTGDAWHVVWPLYLAVHVDPQRGDDACRRCEEITNQRELRRPA